MVSCGFCLCWLTFYLIINLAIPFYFIITGIVKIDECPSDRRLPQWMVVFGAFSLIDRIVEFFSEFFFFKDENGVSLRPTIVLAVAKSLAICEIALAIIGIIWTAQLLRSDSFSCNDFVFWPSFIAAIIALTSITLGLLCFACVCCGLITAGTYQFTRLRTTR